MPSAFLLYLLFVVSWFLHLPTRIPSLGAIRFDLILIVSIAILLFLTRPSAEHQLRHPTTSRLWTLILYIVLTIPFVAWPGSVVKNGSENFVKAAVFYFFTVKILDTEKRLRLFMTVFISTQLFRALEPLYLHFTEGYWGDTATMANSGLLNRLSGSHYDVINPNGLAFVILTIVPFLYFFSRLSVTSRVAATVLIPVLVYELILTESRSGFLGLLTIALTLCLRSKHKLMSAAVLAVAVLFTLSHLSPDQWDRTLSLIDPHARNAATAEGRVAGVLADLEVALRHPLFGHGLGTSQEANAHFRSVDQLSHDLYTEVAQELGFIGLGIFLFFLLSVLGNFSRARHRLVTRASDHTYMHHLVNAMQTWLYMNILFSFASYGLSGYAWYLFAGLSVVVERLLANLPSRDLLLPHALTR